MGLCGTNPGIESDGKKGCDEDPYSYGDRV